MFLFILHAYNEPLELISRAIGSVRNYYPKDPILLLWDNPPTETEYKKKAKKIDISVKQIFCEERLKPLIHGGAWSHRFLEIGLKEFQENKAIEHFLKIDPESLVLRQIKGKMPKTGIFSNLVVRNRVSLQGGALGFNLDAVTKLVESKLLFSDKFKYLNYSYRGSKNYFENTHISCQDAIVYDAALKLSIKINKFPEFSCYPDFQANKIDKSKAIIHPVPLDA